MIDWIVLFVLFDQMRDAVKGFGGGENSLRDIRGEAARRSWKESEKKRARAWVFPMLFV